MEDMDTRLRGKQVYIEVKVYGNSGDSGLLTPKTILYQGEYQGPENIRNKEFIKLIKCEVDSPGRGRIEAKRALISLDDILGLYEI